MNPAENKQLMQHVFEEMARGNTSAMSEAMSEDFRWTFPGSWSWSGTWGPRGYALEALLGPLMEQFSEYRSQADLVLADGDRVVVQAHAHAWTRSGDPYEQTYCYIFRLRDGLICEVIEHCDTALVERVLQPPQSPPLSRTE